MEEQVRETEERRTYFDRDRYSALSRAIWRDFGPLIMGALVLLLVLGGGWYLWNKSRTATPEETAVVLEENGSDISLPTSEITIPGTASPRPSTSPTASPSPATSPSPRPSLSPAPTTSSAGSPLANAGSQATKGGPQVATGAAMAKGGKLPQTGLPFVHIAFFAALPGLGFALHKLSKRI